MYRDYEERLLAQLSIELNCSREDLLAGDNRITLPKMNEGRRSYSPGRPFLQMATLGNNAVIMADECLHGFLREFVKDVEGHCLLEWDCLLLLNEELKAYGYRLNPSHHMFLPALEVETDDRFAVKWFYDSEIDPFYGDPRFTNAIAYPAPCPVRPDRIVLAAYEGDTIMGMAGCSEDAPHWQQIGIDVLPEFRARGIGSYLVSRLKNRIMEMGDIPFYGTAAANVFSQNIAGKSGFRPAWVETEAVRIEEDG